jgi:hypothetical protein
VVALLTTEKEFREAALAIADFTDPRLVSWLAAQRPV